MITENWSDIADFVGLYQVSDLGNVKSLAKCRERKGWRACIMAKKETILKQYKSNSGYYRVRLFKDGKYKNESVHRLVAFAFVANPMEKTTVNHIDGDKSNNTATNLEWNTPAENHAHALNTGLKPKGEKIHRSKMTESKIRQIRAMYDRKDMPTRKIAKEFSLCQTTVADIVARRTWKHI